ncbi:MAG: oxidoreductase, partial [Waddliaceae bacterium]
LVYAKPEYIDTLATSTAIADHIPVDFELRGCPISKHQLLGLIDALLKGRKPNIPESSVCMECKKKGNVCVMAANGTMCLGPVTQEGCGALCPSFNRGCYACFGPKEAPNTASLASWLESHGKSKDELMRIFRGINAYAEPFRKESETHEN